MQTSRMLGQRISSNYIRQETYIVHKKNPFKERHFTKYMLTFCKFVVKTIVYDTELFSLSAPLRRQRTQLLGS